MYINLASPTKLWAKEGSFAALFRSPTLTKALTKEDQRSEIRDQRPEIRGQRSEARDLRPDLDLSSFFLVGVVFSW